MSTRELPFHPALCVATVLALVGSLLAIQPHAPANGATLCIDRVAGATRTQTAVELAPADADVAVLARADDYPDALTGGTLARQLGAPVLLTHATDLDAHAARWLRSARPDTLVVLGGTSAVTEPVARAAARAADGATVTRLAGADRFHTAAVVAQETLARTDVSRVFLVEGAHPDPSRGWPDAVSAAWAAARTRSPMLLTTAGRLPAATRAALHDMAPVDVLVVGGTGAVSESVAAEAQRVAGGDLQRLAGPDRYATSRRVADMAIEEGARAAEIMLATGRNWPDALSAGPTIGDGVLVLAPGSSTGQDAGTARWIRDRGDDSRRLTLIGGPDAFSDRAETDLAAAACPDGSQPPFRPAYPGQPPAGTILWGSSLEGNRDPAERHEEPTGQSLGVRRTFWQWSARTGGLPSTAAADHAAGRVPWVSVKPPSWNEVANGRHDGEIDELLRALDALNGPVWLTVHHEPEGGGGVNAPDDPGGPSAHLAMNRRVRARMTTLGTDNIALAPILMGWTFNPASGRDPSEWWAAGVYDFLGIDHYRHSNTTLLAENWYRVREWAADRGADVAVGEWGVRGTDATAGDHVRDWYDDAVQSSTDGRGARVVGLSAFDSGLNSPDGSWMLQGEQLRAFHELLRRPTSVSVAG